MISLAMETSSPRASLAVLRDLEVLWTRTLASDARHSREMFGALEQACLQFNRFDRIVIGLGPGSYSGIRIAISAGIGLALGMEAELCGLPSIVALETAETDYYVVGDARRGDLFLATINNR